MIVRIRAAYEPLPTPPAPTATAVPVWQDRTIASSKLRMLEYSAFMEVQRDPDNVSWSLRYDLQILLSSFIFFLHIAEFIWRYICIIHWSSVALNDKRGPNLTIFNPFLSVRCSTANIYSSTLDRPTPPTVIRSSKPWTFGKSTTSSQKKRAGSKTFMRKAPKTLSFL